MDSLITLVQVSFLLNTYLCLYHVKNYTAKTSFGDHGAIDHTLNYYCSITIEPINLDQVRTNLNMSNNRQMGAPERAILGPLIFIMYVKNFVLSNADVIKIVSKSSLNTYLRQDLTSKQNNFIKCTSNK